MEWVDWWKNDEINDEKVTYNIQRYIAIAAIFEGISIFLIAFDSEEQTFALKCDYYYGNSLKENRKKSK